MNIVFTRFPLESRHGGAEVQTLALMKGLQERGHEVMFLGSCPVLLEETKKLRMKNEELRIGPPPVSKWNALSFLWRCFDMRRKLHSLFFILHSQFRFDAVVMLSLSEKLLLTPLLHKQGIKIIWIEHDRIGRWLTRNPWLPRLRKLSRYATTIVVSDLSKMMYERLGFANVVAIPNGIDTSRLTRRNPQPVTHNPKLLRIGTIARLSKDKGVDVLIEAVKDLENVSLNIVGTGSEEATLLSAISNLPHITITAHIDDLAEFYTSLDLFVLSSRDHDPFGLVAGEAMMLGVPVIVTDTCGIAGYLTHEHDALIVPTGSLQELRKAIMHLQHHPEKRSLLATVGKATAEEKFSIEKMVERYEGILHVMKN